MLKSFILIVFFSSLNLLSSQTNPVENDSTSFEMTKKPSEALWRSVIPGWGQVYNEEYWKAPILFSAAASLTGLIIHFNSEFNDYRSQIETALDARKRILLENPDQADNKYFYIENQTLSSRQVEILKDNSELARDRRDLSGLYLLGVYVISTVDAYVGTHLYDFNVDEDVSLNFLPRFDGALVVSLSYSF